MKWSVEEWLKLKGEEQWNMFIFNAASLVLWTSVVSYTCLIWLRRPHGFKLHLTWMTIIDQPHRNILFLMVSILFSHRNSFKELISPLHFHLDSQNTTNDVAAPPLTSSTTPGEADTIKIIHANVRSTTADIVLMVWSRLSLRQILQEQDQELFYFDMVRNCLLGSCNSQV